MRITTQGEYAMRVLVRLASVYQNASEREYIVAPVSVTKLAGWEDLSRAYVEQLLLRLRRGGIVNSRRGVHGGYFLSRPPENITVKDVLDALDEQFVTPCEYPTVCNHGVGCGLRILWEGLGICVGEYLASKTLADVQKMMQGGGL